MKLSTTSLIQFATKIVVTAAGFISTVVFGRFLGPDVLGAYFLVIALVGWLQFGSELGVSKAIQKKMSELKSPGTFLSAGGVIFTTTVAVMVVSVLLFKESIEAYIGAEVGVLVAIMLVAKMTFSFGDSGLRGYHRVAAAASMDFSATLIRVALQVGLVFAGFGLSALLTGYAAAFGFIGLVAIYVLVSEAEFTRPRKRHFTETIEYAQYSWLTILKTHVSASIDTIILGFFVANSLVGIYGASWNIAVVLVLASQSLSSTLFPTLSKLSADEKEAEFRGILSESLIYAGIVCIPGVVGLALVGPDLLRIYGAAFPKGSTIAVILGVFAVFSSYESVLRTALDAFDRPDLTFRINGVFVVLNLLGNIWLIATIGWMGAAIATTFSMGVSLLYSYMLADRIVGVELPVGELARQVGAAVVMGIVVYGVNRLVATLPYYYVVLPIGVGIVSYFGVILLVSEVVRQKAVELIPWDSTGQRLSE